MRNLRGQSTLEYMLLLGTVVVIVLVGFKVFLPRVQNSSDLYFNRVSYGITDKGPACGDGQCDDPKLPGGNPYGVENSETCCVDCGGCVL